VGQPFRARENARNLSLTAERGRASGIAPSAAIKAQRYRLTSDELGALRAWLDGCDITWRECEDDGAAHDLEAAMKAEFLPPLTKR
jgi:hypothetical protein